MNSKWFAGRLRTLLPLLLALILLLAACSGCAIPSGPKQFESPAVGQADPDASAVLSQAAEYTREKARKFWFSGWIVTEVGNQRTTSMYDGVALLPDQLLVNDRLLVNARLLGKAYRYYRHGEMVAIAADGIWNRVDETAAPTPPMGNLKQLAELAEGLPASHFKDEVIIGQPTAVLEFVLPASRLVQALESLGIDTSLLESVRVDQAETRLTVWVGKNEPYLCQYRFVSVLPVTGAGAMELEVFFRFWDFNNDQIQPGEFLKTERDLEKLE